MYFVRDVKIKLMPLGAFAKSRKATISVVMSVCLFTWNNSAPTRRIFIKCDLSIFRKSVRKIQDSLKSNKKRVLYINNRAHLCSLAESMQG
jgi:hypothetical protein